MRSPFTIPVAMATTFSAAVLLSGCFLLPTGQTTVDACLQIADGLNEVSTGITSAGGRLVDDPPAAAAEITEVAATFADDVDAVTNPEVHAAGVLASEAITAFAVVLSEFAEDPASGDIEALTASGDEVQVQLAAVTEVCSP